MLTDEEIVDHVQHMGYEEMDVELIESDDDGVDIGPSKMTLEECRESPKGIANFIAQDACLGGEDLLQVLSCRNRSFLYIMKYRTYKRMYACNECVYTKYSLCTTNILL